MTGYIALLRKVAASDLASIFPTFPGANREAAAFLVDVATRPSRSVRVNVMLPEEVIEAIDRKTNNRSRFLTEAARAKLHETA